MKGKQAEKDYFLALAQGTGSEDWPWEKQGVEGLEAAEAHVQSTTMDLWQGGNYSLARRLPSCHFYSDLCALSFYTVMGVSRQKSELGL